MKRKKKPLLLTALIISLLLSFITAASAADKPVDTSAAAKTEQLKQIFSDVTATDNNAIFINYLNNRKILSGFPDGKFHPEEGLTRAEAAVVLVNAAGLKTPAVTETGFPDVKADHWAAATIAAASKAGYLKGFPDGTFKPEDKLTRAQGISLVMRLSTQKERPPLPVLKDMEKSHWAAGDMAVALAAEMIGLSADGRQVFPEAVMKRGNLARALGTLLTKDPGLYTISLEGTIKDVKGEIKLIRKGTTTPLQNGSNILLGDTIKIGSNASASISYPDGSSVLIKENTEINIKESIGRAYIKSDGSSATAVDNLDIDLKKGTVFGALATKHEATEKQSSRANSPLLASLDSRQFIADNEADQFPPWYQTAQTKKVKMKVDMPWGVAAVRGTFISVSLNPNGTCNVSCLTGDAEIRAKIGNSVPLTSGTSSTIVPGQTAETAGKMSEKDKQAFGEVQGWLINTALQMDKNIEATPVPEIILEISDKPLSEEKQAEQVTNMLNVVLKGMEISGIQLTDQVKQDLQQQLQNLQQEQIKAVQEAIDNNKGTQQQNQTNSNQGGVGSSSVSYINYASPGTYGPATPEARETIAKNVILGSSGIILRNTIITGDLTLGAGIGNGSVTLKNVKVQGNTNILGGGPNSVNIEDCELYTVNVDNQTNTVRIVAKGTTTVGALTLNSGAKLEESELSGAGFSSVTTGLSLPPGANVILIGKFDAFNINAPGINLTLADGTSVDTLQVNAAGVNVEGQGSIKNAYINAAGLVMAQSPLNITVANGVHANVGGQDVSSDNSQIVKTITISGADSVSLPASGEKTSPYTAEVKDQNDSIITGAGITWSISSPVSGVSIDPVTGILNIAGTAQSGTISIKAQANSNSKVSAQITVNLLPSWKYLGEGISGTLLAGSDISLLANSNNQFITAYTEDGADGKGPVKATVFEKLYGAWNYNTSVPDVSKPGKGPLDLTDLDGFTLGWWDDSGQGSQTKYIVIKTSGDGLIWNDAATCDAGASVSALSVVGEVTAYLDENGAVQVKAPWDSGWENVGSLNNPAASELDMVAKFGSNGRLGYLAYRDGNGIKVMKLRGGSSPGNSEWQALGSAIAGTGLALDIANGIPYLAYHDAQGYAQVSRYDATTQTWIKIGDKASPGAAENLSLCVVPNGTPYLAFSDSTRAGQASVTKCVYENGTFKWIPLGAGLSPAAAGVPQLDIGGDTLYLGFKDGNAGGKFSVMSYNDPLAAVDFNFLTGNSGNWKITGLQAGMEYSLTGGANDSDYIKFNSSNPDVNYVESSSPVSSDCDILVRMPGTAAQPLRIDILPAPPMPNAVASAVHNMISGLQFNTLYQLDFAGDEKDGLYTSDEAGEINLSDYDFQLGPGQPFKIRTMVVGKQIYSEWKRVTALFPATVEATVITVSSAASIPDPPLINIPEVADLPDPGGITSYRPNTLNGFYYGFIKGNYIYWPYDDNQNASCLRIVAYDLQTGDYVKIWDKIDAIRYIQGISFNSDGVTFIGQSSTLFMPWDELTCTPLLQSPNNYGTLAGGLTAEKTKITGLNLLPSGASEWRYVRLETRPETAPELNQPVANAGTYYVTDGVGAEISAVPGNYIRLLATDGSGQVKAYADLLVKASQIHQLVNTTMSEITPGSISQCEENKLTVTAGGTTANLKLVFDDGYNHICRGVSIIATDTTAVVAAKVYEAFTSNIPGYTIDYSLGSTEVLFTNEASDDRNVIFYTEMTSSPDQPVISIHQAGALGGGDCFMDINTYNKSGTIYYVVLDTPETLTFEDIRYGAKGIKSGSFDTDDFDPNDPGDFNGPNYHCIIGASPSYLGKTIYAVFVDNAGAESTTIAVSVLVHFGG